MAFQFRDLVLFMDSTPRTDHSRLRLQDVDALTVPIHLGELEIACPGRTSGGFISLDSLEDLKKALADLEAQL